jgi:8-oxo-dGTP pyrophosphatase MutT (NUDIX family)
MAPSLECGYNDGDPQAVAREVIEKIGFPGQACGRPPGAADYYSAGIQSCFHDRVAVSAAKDSDHF